MNHSPLALVGPTIKLIIILANEYLCDLYIVPTTEFITSAVPTTDAETVVTTTESITEPETTPADTTVAPPTQSKYARIHFKQILLFSEKYHMILQCISCN